MNPIENRLRDLGLTGDETLLYMHLLQVKSATVREICSSPGFKAKRRSNIYKVINKLHAKGFLIEEVKDGRLLSFPVMPHVILTETLKKKEEELQNIREAMPGLIESLEAMFGKPWISADTIPSPLKPIVESVPAQWVIKESPVKVKQPGLGNITSVEFNTRRRFGGDSAGLVYHEFAYPEHARMAFDAAREFEKESMRTSLMNVIKQGPIHIRKFWFEEARFVDSSSVKGMKYTLVHTQLNFPGDFKGGLASFIIVQHPTAVLSAWGADLRDFTSVVRAIAGGRELFQP